MNKKLRAISLALAGAMAACIVPFGITGCGGKENKNDQKTDDQGNFVWTDPETGIEYKRDSEGNTYWTQNGIYYTQDKDGNTTAKDANGNLITPDVPIDPIKPPAENATDVTFWANCDSTELQVFQNIVEKFNAQNEGLVKVTLVPKSGSNYDTGLKLSLSSSNPPDVFYVGDSGYKGYAELGLLEDITDQVMSSKIYDISEMWENVVTRYKYDTKTMLSGTDTGRYYGVPKDLGPTVIFYNETYFENAGVTVISVDKNDLDAFNAGTKADDRGKTKAQYGIEGTVKEKGYFELGGKKYFNNQIPMSWEETNTLSKLVQDNMRKDKSQGGEGKSNGYGYFTEWWFNYGWSVGGNCIQQIPTDDPSYPAGYYYDFTLMDGTKNYIVADDVEGTIKVNNKDYSAGQIIEYADKIDMSGYAKTIAAGGSSKKGSYQVTSEVTGLAAQGKLKELPSQREAFTEFVRLGSDTNVTVDTGKMGYGICPKPQDIGTDAGKTNAFTGGNLAMLVDGRWNVTSFRETIDTSRNPFKWDVAPLPMYKEYDANGDITVHGVEAGHSGSVALCISSKSPVKAAAWKFIEYCGSREGQGLQADAGFAIPLQKDLANSERFLQTDKNPRNSKIFIRATEYETAGDWWILRDNLWINDWAGKLNGSVRKGEMTMTQFYDCSEYNKTFGALDAYAKYLKN